MPSRARRAEPGRPDRKKSCPEIWGGLLDLLGGLGPHVHARASVPHLGSVLFEGLTFSTAIVRRVGRAPPIPLTEITDSLEAMGP